VTATRLEAWFWWRCGVRDGGTRGQCGVVISWGQWRLKKRE